MAIHRTKLAIEYLLIWKFSLISSCAGLVLSYLTVTATGEYAFIFLGLAHAIVFLPTMILSQTKLWKTIVASIVCLTFPFWGIMVGMFVFSVAAPLVDSLMWGLLVAWVLKQPWAILMFLIVGVLSNISLFVVLHFDLGSSSDWGIPQTIGAWYVFVLPAMPILFWLTQARTMNADPYACPTCGYSLFGLSRETPCPECGTPRSIDALPSTSTASNL